MCKHEKLAKIDTLWRCRECGEIFTEKPEGKVVSKAKIEDAPIEVVPNEAPAKKAPAKKTAKKGAK